MPHRPHLVAALAAVLLLPAAAPARALTFSFSTVANDTLTAAQQGSFTAAANAWSAVLTDPFVVTLQIGFRSLGGNILGQTAPQLQTGAASYIKGLLAADAKDASDAAAIASLPASPAGNLIVSKAQLKALGAAATGIDGTIEFSSDYSFTTQRDAQGGIAAGTYDLVGIAEHEIAHLLGFDSGLDLVSPAATLLDEFRYASAGTRSFAVGSPAYFSIDGGATRLASFADGTANNQASHWSGTSRADGNIDRGRPGPQHHPARRPRAGRHRLRREGARALEPRAAGHRGGGRAGRPAPPLTGLRPPDTPSPHPPRPGRAGRC